MNVKYLTRWRRKDGSEYTARLITEEYYKNDILPHLRENKYRLLYAVRCTLKELPRCSS